MISGRTRAELSGPVGIFVITGSAVQEPGLTLAAGHPSEYQLGLVQPVSHSGTRRFLGCLAGVRST